MKADWQLPVPEFYHRASLTSYCSAFSYRPVSYRLSDSSSDNCYLELPTHDSPFLSQFMTNAADDEMVDRQSTTGSPDSGAVMDEDVFTCLQYQVFTI